MTEVGTIVDIGNNNRVVVEINRSSACDGCHARGACSMTFQSRLTRVEAIDIIGVKVGQRVALEISDKTFLAACAIVYGIPLLLLVAGAVLGHLVYSLFGSGTSGSGEGATAIGAFAGLGLGFLITRMINKRIERREGKRKRSEEVSIRKFNHGHTQGQVTELAITSSGQGCSSSLQTGTELQAGRYQAKVSAVLSC